MKKLLTILCVATTVLLACQKEIIFEEPNIPPPVDVTGTKLIRIGTRFGADSFTTNYFYTGDNRIAGYTQAGTFQGQQATAELRLVRNASNIITAQIIKSNVFSSIGFDSLIVRVGYNVANSRYTYTATTFTAFGTTVSDSIIYTYDAIGRLATGISMENEGSGYVPLDKEEYTYADNNLATVKTYAYNDATSTYELEETTTLEYDTKINPLQFVADAVILGVDQFYSANNVVKRTVSSSGSSNIIGNTVYVYNNADRPITGSISEGSNFVGTNSYYYQ